MPTDFRASTPNQDESVQFTFKCEIDQARARIPANCKTSEELKRVNTCHLWRLTPGQDLQKQSLIIKHVKAASSISDDVSC